MANKFIEQTYLEYSLIGSMVDLSDVAETQIKNLFPCKSGALLDDEFAFLTRYGSISSYREFRTMERAHINSIIASIQEQEKEEAEAKKEALENNNNKSGMVSY